MEALKMRVSIFILREPAPWRPELFLKTDDGKEFVYALPEKVLWHIHNETGVYLATINNIRREDV